MESLPGNPLEGRRGVGRTEAFSDGVFAIAITLLVLTLRVPEGPVGPGLRELLPAFGSFALSFAVIGIYWLAHHRVFGYIRYADGRLLLVNLAFLFCIAFLPFPTDLVGRHEQDATAVVFYAASLGATGLLSGSIWAYAWSAGLVDERVDGRLGRYFVARSLLVPIFTAISIPIAFANVNAAKYCWLAPFVAQRVVSRWYGRTRPGRDDSVTASRRN